MMHSPPIDLSWQQGDISTFLPIILSLVFFAVYWFTAKSDKVKAWFYKKNDPDRASVNHIGFTRLVGFVSMGILPVTFCLIFLPEYSIADYGLTWNSETTVFSFLWITGLSILVIPLAYISAKKPQNLINYPQIRTKTWTKKIVFINAISWALYLLGYEFLFRGVLLIPLVDSLGVWTAIAINIALYSATHIPKGLTETIGAAPLGLVLCLLTLSSGTIWIAFFVHLVMALTNSFTALKFHPDMHYIGSTK
jgi:membrane protease YdiL (CAAX protease family)